MNPVATPADGWWWVLLSPTTPGGADRRWTVFRVLDGVVQPHGSVAWYSPAAPWLRGAEWVPASPPVATASPALGTAARRESGAGRHDGDGVWRVAAEVVGVFIGLSDDVADYYRLHPSHRDDLVAVVARIMRKARR